ncbi:cyclase/dehydrase [Alloactinosynnema sp. L-07]|uniref:SRPBCC family protein n=1 Tax=Alloactinosynnema sp. L-07 TaxID=1653480 RepID=UPI00065EF7E9|nr:SRPBCC family protein [Alloactinosynnema sp. L-07]CRK58304.1 cyclase/dehydrase [Alloactinosynnema sp. L-07]
MKITEMQITVEFPVLAEAADVWAVLSDIPRMATWSPECVHAAWRDEAPVEPGTRFEATNKMGDWSWDVTGEIVAIAENNKVTWVVRGLDENSDQPSSTWSYELAPLPSGGTLIRHTFTHGQGGSHLVTLTAANPDHADAIIEGRTRMLRENMTSTLAAMAKQMGWPVPSLMST